MRRGSAARLELTRVFTRLAEWWAIVGALARQNADVTIARIGTLTAEEESHG